MMVQSTYPRRVTRQLKDIVQHHAVLRRNGRLRVIALQRRDQRVIQRHPTQKLCVRGDSIPAPVGDGHHRGDHLVLAAGERKLVRHQHAERREGVIQRIGNQAMRRDDARRSVVGWLHRAGILDRIQRTLRFQRSIDGASRPPQGAGWFGSRSWRRAFFGWSPNVNEYTGAPSATMATPSRACSGS